jgi:hypothetical protein
MVGSQIASLTPGPSFAHNLSDRCPNGQCEGNFDIYASRPFQWHQENPNARCFGPCCRALNIRESRRTPNSQLFQVLGFTPTLGQVRVATSPLTPCMCSYYCPFVQENLSLVFSVSTNYITNSYWMNDPSFKISPYMCIYCMALATCI